MPRKPKAGARSTIGSNPERNRSHNRRVVLDVVRQLGPVGRMEISRHAHLSTQAVSNIVEDLVAEHDLVVCPDDRVALDQVSLTENAP